MESISEAYRVKKEFEQAMSIGSSDKLFDIIASKVQIEGLDQVETAPSGKITKVGNVEIKSVIKIDPEAEIQKKAYAKYPSLIKMLAKEDSEDLADYLGEAINSYIVRRVESNSKSLSANALNCKQENNTLKIYYKYDDKAGYVKLAGEFDGSEHVQHDYLNNKAYVLSKKAGQFVDVTNKFDISIEFVGLEDK